MLDLAPARSGRCSAHIGLLDVDAVYVSHLHADHCIDLVACSYARRYHPDGHAAAAAGLRPGGHCATGICGVFEAPPPDGLQRGLRLPRGAGRHASEIGPFTVTDRPA